MAVSPLSAAYDARERLNRSGRYRVAPPLDPRTKAGLTAIVQKNQKLLDDWDAAEVIAKRLPANGFDADLGNISPAWWARVKQYRREGKTPMIFTRGSPHLGYKGQHSRWGVDSGIAPMIDAYSDFGQFKAAWDAMIAKTNAAASRGMAIAVGAALVVTGVGMSGMLSGTSAAAPAVSASAAVPATAPAATTAAAASTATAASTAAAQTGVLANIGSYAGAALDTLGTVSTGMSMVSGLSGGGVPAMPAMPDMTFTDYQGYSTGYDMANMPAPQPQQSGGAGILALIAAIGVPFVLFM